jgi:hypothetical protein
MMGLSFADDTEAETFLEQYSLKDNSIVSQQAKILEAPPALSVFYV